MSTQLQVILGVVAVLVGALTSVLTVKASRKTSREQNTLTGDNNLVTQYGTLLDQVQEERAAKAAEITALKERMDKMESREQERATTQQRRDSIIRRYIYELHRHINDKLPPPPPPFPAGWDD